MGLPKTRTNNPNGRPKGTTNKVTNDIRERIKQIIDDNMEQLENDIKELEPKDRLIFIEKLFKYAIPTLQATTISTNYEQMTDEQLDEVINRLENNIL